MTTPEVPAPAPAARAQAQVPVTAAGRSAAQREVGTVLLLIALAGAGALLCAGRDWVTVTAHRPRPLPDDVLAVSGHSLHPAVSGFAVVALAAIVAILASGTRLRRGIGIVLAGAGIGVAWQGALGLATLQAGRALDLVQNTRSGVGVQAASQIDSVSHRAWPVLALLAGVVIALAGLVTVLRAGRWATLSRRYEAPGSASTPDAPSPAVTPGVASDSAAAGTTGTTGTTAHSTVAGGTAAVAPTARDLALWNQLDRGEDPTA